MLSNRVHVSMDQDLWTNGDKPNVGRVVVML